MTKREKTQITRVRNEKGDITTNLKEINRLIKEHCGQLCANKLDNLDKIDKFPEKTYTTETDSRKVDNLNWPITNKEIKLLIKMLLTKKNLGPGGFSNKFY